jgi:hypothetical protein
MDLGNLRSPYLGIAATMNVNQISWTTTLSRVMKRFGSARSVAAGLQISHKSLHSELVRRPERLPKVIEVEQWLPDAFAYLASHGNQHKPTKLRNEIHIHFSPGRSGKHRLGEDLEELGNRLGQWVHGLQINAEWPNPEVVKVWREKFPHHRIILSVSYGMTHSGRNPEELAQEIRMHYGGLISDILFDESGGEGLLISAQWATIWLAAIQRELPQVGLGVAGGLGPGRTGEVAKLMQNYPVLSVDAESWLLSPATKGLDLIRVEAFAHEIAFLDYLCQFSPVDLGK